MLTKNQVKDIHQECVAALQGVAKKHGVEIKSAGGSFGAFDATLKFTVVKSDSAAKAAMRERDEKEFKTLASLYNLPADSFGKTFVSAGKSYTICGVRSRATRCPILTVNAEGKKFVWPVESIKLLLKQTA